MFWHYAILTLSAMWSAGCILLPLGAVVYLFRDRSWVTATGMLLIGFPICFLLAIIPWAVIADSKSPDLVTLKKNAWFCSHEQTEQSMMAVSTGKTTTMVPTTISVCDTYSSR